VEKEPKTIVYRGVKYTLNKGYYKTTYSLHRRIWEDHFGEIPIDHHIHHKNGNSLDNRIENLECIHKSKHHSMHFSAQRQLEKMHSPESRLKAKEWARSSEAKKMLGIFSKKQWEKRKPIKRECVICGVEFLTKNLNGTKYCSQVCRSRCQKLREMVWRSCLICQKGFQTRNYSQASKTCSRKCKGLLISKTKLERSHDNVSSTY